MRHKRNKKEPNLIGSVISIVIMLLMLAGDLGIGLLSLILLIAMVVGIIALPIWLIRRRKHIAGHQKQLKNTTYDRCPQQKAWDEKVQDLFCFHKDKAFHHVRRGREIDPWDRPDIDIRKYQRKQ